MKALLLVCFVLVSLSSGGGRVFGNPLSAQPVIGLATEYTANPTLTVPATRSEFHEALLLNLPVNYDLDTLHFAVTPNIRYSDATGYSSLASNYYHFDASAQLKTELDSLTLSGALYRDASLLYAGELANGLGVRRDTSTIDTQWLRYITERITLQLDANTSRTLYGREANRDGLVDYRYSTFAPNLAYAVNERNTLHILGSVGRYYSLNGSTSSDSVNLQLGFDRQLDELWKLSATAGYSRSTNEDTFSLYKLVDGVVYPVSEKLKSRQSGAVYSANLVRQSDVFGFSAGVSRSLVPSGFAYLNRQDGINLSLNYAYSERFTFTAGLTWQNLVTPVSTGYSVDHRFYDVDLAALWHWTELWTVTLRGTKIGQRFGQPAVTAISNNVSLEISRQFNRTNY